MPALRLGPPDPGDHPLPDQVPLELRDRAQNVEHQPPGWGGGIDRLVRDDEVNPERLELSREAHEVPRRPSQAIELVVSTMSSRRARAAARSVSRAGRLVRPPLTPSSAYSVAAHPHASANARSTASWFSGTWSVVDPRAWRPRSQRPASGRDAILGTAAGRDAQGLGDRAHA